MVHPCRYENLVLDMILSQFLVALIFSKYFQLSPSQCYTPSSAGFKIVVFQEISIQTVYIHMKHTIQKNWHSSLRKSWHVQFTGECCRLCARRTECFFHCLNSCQITGILDTRCCSLYTSTSH